MLERALNLFIYLIAFIYHISTSQELQSIKDLQETKFTVESLWIEIPCKMGKVLAVGVYYRPPGQNEQMDDEMLEEIREANKNYNTMIIMGDFNYPGIDWVSVTAGHAREIKFLDEINDCFLEQLVNETTRGEAILD